MIAHKIDRRSSVLFLRYSGLHLAPWEWCKLIASILKVTPIPSCVTDKT
jgi:hypothetical protein